MNLIRDIKIVTAATLLGSFALVHLTIAAAQAETVTVNVLLVTSYGDFDYEQPATERRPDFFASLYIDDTRHRTAAIHNEANVAPNWQFSREIYQTGGNSRYVKVHLGIGDADGDIENPGNRLMLAQGPVDGKFEAADINPVEGKTGIDLVLDLETCHLHSPSRDGVQITRAATSPDGTDACRFQVTGVGDHPMYSASAVFEVTADVSR